jgi:hypothetical protein
MFVALVEDTLADAAKQQWKGDPESSCRIMTIILDIQWVVPDQWPTRLKVKVSRSHHPFNHRLSSNHKCHVHRQTKSWEDANDGLGMKAIVTITTTASNMLLLITNDQDDMLEQGITFDKAIVHTPIGCPSRTSILTTCSYIM